MFGASAADGGTGMIDVSDRRMEAVAGAFCKLIFTCDPEMIAAQQFGTQSACAMQLVGFTKEDMATDGQPCGDAELDLYECYANVPCAEQDSSSACNAAEDNTATLCPNAPMDVPSN
ncbi:MAG TPA: hypothetical protein VG963_18925 [Polyangiaceae bacterium]|nr:hypothetical protein [Polyangiaceae bacterium]